MVAFRLPSIRLGVRHEPATGAMQKGHVAALDGIRGLAILLVTVYRFYTRGQGDEFVDGGLWSILAYGYRGVDLFFVLSGFLITGILYDAKGDPHYFRNFYARRSLRIFPLYYGVLFMALVVLPAFSVAAKNIFADSIDHQAWLWLYGTNILQARDGAWPFGCLNHFWSLAVEEHFYLVWPLVIAVSSRRTAIWACGVVIATAMATRVAWLLSGGNDIAPEVFTFFRADALAMGGLVALLARGPQGMNRLNEWAGLGIWILGLVLLAVTIGQRRLLTIPDTLFAAFFVCVLVKAVCTPTDSVAGAFWNSRWLRFFGKYSYAMYVYQYPLIPMLAPILSIEIVANRIGSVAAARVLYIVLMTAITAGCAVVSWHLAEKRFLALKKYFDAPAMEARS